MKNVFLSFLLSITFLLINQNSVAQSKDIAGNKINLAGNWSFQIDSLDKGITGKWFSKALNDNIKLPGSMTTNNKGNEITVNTPWTGSIVDSTWFTDPVYARYRKPGDVKVPFWLQPTKYYKGAAWYQKNINIPSSWKGRKLELFIERSHWETTVWIDDKLLGKENSLATPHVFNLPDMLTEGVHRLTIRVDNRVKDFDVGPNSHSISDHTQSNWNGMIGELSLRAKPTVTVQDVQLFPDVANKKVVAKIQIYNAGKKSTNASINLNAISKNAKAQKLDGMNKQIRVDTGFTDVQLTYDMGSSPLLWDEFSPELYTMNVSINPTGGTRDERAVVFGMRNFTAQGTQFSINGRPVFLRGTLECAIFPKTGYPPTEVAEWARIFKIARSYGLNHIRFHSWCPPEAAFVAADEAGFYLQIECSSWANQGATIGDGKPLDNYIYEESRRISQTYGNHPSFVMMAYGNEPAGKNHVKYLTEFVNYWKARDSRRQYTTGAGWPVIDESDFSNTPDPRIQAWGQGLKSIINSLPPQSSYDWSSIISKWRNPVVSHEIGQWCVYPDFKETSEYTGVLKAKNFEIFQDKLKENGMIHLADSFLLASGKLQTLCYKADIEAALRTKGFGGFQLLDLHDFPGQGTALVGVLNPFWEEKGYVTAAEYSRFCDAVVPLARFPKMVYLNNEELVVPVELANFGREALTNVVPAWSITDRRGEVLFKGTLPATSAPVANGFKLGEIKQALTSFKQAADLTLTVSVNGNENSWDFYVYPAQLPETGSQIVVTQQLDSKALAVLNKGGKVLLTIKKGSVKPETGGDVAVGFSSIFWNTAWTGGQAPHTLGILCDPKHPVLKHFPTEYYSNWQWWDAMSHSNAIRLDAVADDLQPLIRVIDDWVTARPLGLLFECKVGKGKLIVSGIDLVSEQSNRPEARQLLYSIKDYMSSDAFNPKSNVQIDKIQSLFNNQLSVNK